MKMKQLKKFGMVAMVVLMMLSLVPVAMAQDMEKININTATAEELTQLKGIGEAYAKAIVEFREKNGPFVAIEDIMKVTGIGEKTFQAIKDMITI